ncbi:hypothetical protein [Streptomyces mirabilis]|uniref:hypothetical protein n=1 Tax=Streptomyces mirabilis TaxID=68239 RepID=UPI003688AC6A
MNDEYPLETPHGTEDLCGLMVTRRCHPARPEDVQLHTRSLRGNERRPTAGTFVAAITGSRTNSRAVIDAPGQRDRWPARRGSPASVPARRGAGREWGLTGRRGGRGGEGLAD